MKQQSKLLSYLISIAFPLICMAVQANDADIVKPTTDFSKAEQYESFPAGALTHQKKLNSNAFSHASANMSFERELDFKIGNAFFRRIWVTSPSSTKSSDGLGPLFNARSCQRCHIKDGRGHPPENNQDSPVSILLRLSIPAETEEQKRQIESGKKAVIEEPIYGTQLQDFSVPGVFAEGKFNVRYKETSKSLSENQSASLRKPEYWIDQLRYGNLHKNIMLSPRVAPQMIGLGLLEVIDEKDILALADPEDNNNDGISGKVRYVWDHAKNERAIGRFGHKAGMPNLNQQNQAAFNHDIGLSTELFPNPNGECTTQQRQCNQMPNGNGGPNDSNGDNFLEVGPKVSEKVLHYTRNLAVPERRDVNHPDVLAGKKVFYSIGCTSCHTPKFITPRETPQPEQSRQLIWPYTDMLLHDMGEGLADNRPEGNASGREWRTPPLWGIGLTPVVNGHSYYLHDGRARNILEAILWHGGEAQKTTERFIALTQKERQQLIRFVNSL